jgi:hypothetical protein
MRNRDVRVAAMLDSNRGWLYKYESGREPTVSYVLGNVPRTIRRVVEDYMTRGVKSDREKHVRELYKDIMAQLDGATDIVLLGPGTPKDEVANLIRDTPRFKEVTLRTEKTEWMDEPAFERYAREKLGIPEETPALYTREPKYIPRHRMGGPGSPVEPANYQRTAVPKWKDGAMGRGKTT